MILFLGDGGLGNQLLQYVGLKKQFPKEKLVFVGYQNINKLFNNIDAKFISMKKNSFFYSLKYLIIFFIKIRLLGVVYEDTGSKNYKISIKKGLFWWILVCHNIYFQHKDIIEKIENAPNLKDKIKQQGLDWLEEKKINIKDNNIIFVHIRRGDYLYWPSKEFPGVLDINWYKKSINLMEKKFSNPIFILMGDDQQYLYDCFEESDSFFISKNSAKIDLSIMSFCCGGILSASSFAWWGAFYAKSNNNSHFIAPNYWLGHRKKQWFPENFNTSWISYIE